jgi:hypothetical protein
MRIFLFAGIAVAAAICSAMIPTSAAAQAQNYPFCIKGDGYGGPVGDCTFETLAACQAAAAGRTNFCDANPYYAAPKPDDNVPPKPAAVDPKKRSRPY